MAQIVNTLGDNALRLQNQEFVRALPWGANWKRVRIAVNVSIPQMGGAGFTAGLFIGLCQGTVDTYKSASCVEWVGRAWSGAATYQASPTAVSWTTPNPQGVYKKNTTVVAGTTAAVNSFIAKSVRSTFIVELTTIATGYNLGYSAPSSVGTDVVGRDFELFALAETLTNQDMTMTSNYALDTVSVYWDYAAVGLEFNEICVVRMA